MESNAQPARHRVGYFLLNIDLPKEGHQYSEVITMSQGNYFINYTTCERIVRMGGRRHSIGPYNGHKIIIKTIFIHDN